MPDSSFFDREIARNRLAAMNRCGRFPAPLPPRGGASAVPRRAPNGHQPRTARCRLGGAPHGQRPTRWCSIKVRRSADFRTLVQDQIAPAIRRYADFLERECLPAARDAIAVSANAGGAPCYAAAIRQWSTLPKTPQEVHDMLGKLEIVAACDEARQRQGDRFDIKRFHDRVLDDGAVPLTFLRTKLRDAF